MFELSERFDVEICDPPTSSIDVALNIGAVCVAVNVFATLRRARLEESDSAEEEICVPFIS